MTFKILDIPFNKLIGLMSSDRPKEYIYMLEEREDYTNHLGTVHAGVMFSLAESTGGEFLLREFSEIASDIIPVIRKAEVKYNKPGKGVLYSNASLIHQEKHEVINEFKQRKKMIIKVNTEVYNSDGEKIMSAVFDWFVISNPME